MATLYVDRRGAELDFKDGQVCVREPGQPLRGYPCAGLERLIVSGNVTLQSRLLTHLSAQGASVLFIEGRGARRHAHLNAPSHGDAGRRLGQYALCSDPQHVLRWARMLVHARGAALVRLYRRALALRPDLRSDLLPAQRAILDKLSRVRGTQNLASLRGVEGAIAAAHFAAYAALFAPTLGFTGRNRRPPRDPVNAALSLGYTLTHVDAVRACLTAGLDPLLGSLHEPAHGRESLACDLNELARTDVERIVWRLFADKTLRAESFETHAGGVSLNKSARQHFYAAFEGQAAAHRRRLRRAAAALARDCERLAKAQAGIGHVD